MEIPEENSIMANCNISGPILYPGLEIKSFNGLAWSNTLGMIHQTLNTSTIDPSNYLGNG